MVQTSSLDNGAATVDHQPWRTVARKAYESALSPGALKYRACMPAFVDGAKSQRIFLMAICVEAIERSNR